MQMTIQQAVFLNWSLTIDWPAPKAPQMVAIIKYLNIGNAQTKKINPFNIKLIYDELTLRQILQFADEL